jgi:hypothetical protein
MTGDRDPIDEWRQLSARAARMSGYRRARRRSVRMLPTGLGVGIGVVALVVAAAGLALRPSPEPGANEPVASSTDDGMFRLELTTPRGTFGPGYPIAPVARVTYLGPDHAIAVSHSHSRLVFQVEEVDSKRRMEGGSRLSCESTNLVKDEPLDVPFGKSGSPTNDPREGFDRAWYEDPTLTLPIGTWRITANMNFGVGGCRSDHVLHVSNVIRVVAATSDGPVVDVAQDDAFRLELSVPRRTYRPNEAIDPAATVTFLGPAAETVIRGWSIVPFEIEEVDGPRTFYPALPASCGTSTMRRDTPLTFPFVKYGLVDGPFGRAWYADPVLRLPVGTWRIRAYTAMATDDGPAPSDGSFTCGTRGHSLQVAIVITVEGDAAPSAGDAAPSSTSPTSSSVDVRVE